jgi:hypothetical protein
LELHNEMSEILKVEKEPMRRKILTF